MALVVVQICFGLFPLFGKWAFESFEPRAVAGWRIASGALVLGLAAFWRHGRRALPSRGDLLRLQFYALLGVVLNQLLYLEGLKRTPVINAGLVMCLIPVFTLVIAIALRQERPSFSKNAGTLIAFAGTAWLALQKGPAFDAEYRLGNLLLVLNSLAYSFYLVLSKPLTRRLPPLAIIAWVFLLSSWTIPLFADGTVLRPEAAGGRAWASLAFILVFPTSLAYFLNIFALARVPASVTALYIFSQPLIVGAAGIFILGERPVLGTWLAAAAILAGIALVLRKPGPRRRLR